MRLRTAKKILRQWPIYRISTTRQAYQVAYEKLSNPLKQRLWDSIRILARIKANRFSRLMAKASDEATESRGTE